VPHELSRVASCPLLSGGPPAAAVQLRSAAS
jgi:hypothetical protein